MSMRPFDPSFLGQGGQTLQGVRPPRMVCEGQMSSQQAAQVQRLYLDFKQEARLSVVRHLQRTHMLPDGTQVRLFCHGPDYSVHVVPAQDEGDPKAFVAYAAQLDPAYLPLFDREVIDTSETGDLKDLPPEPVFEFKEPMPEDSSLEYATFEHIDNFDPETQTGSITRKFSWRGVTISGSASFVNISPDNNPNSRKIQVTFSNFLNVPIEWANGVNRGSFRISIRAIAPGKYFTSYRQDNLYFGFSGEVIIDGLRFYDKAYVNICSHLKDGAPITHENTTYPSIQSRTYLEGESMQYDSPEFLSAIALTGDFHEQLIAAWKTPTPLDNWNNRYQEAYEYWKQTTWRAWFEECERLRKPWSNGPDVEQHGLTIARKKARIAQVGALCQHLDSGVTDPHLAARFLSLPVLVNRAPKLPLPLQGTVTRSEVVHETYRDYPAEALNYQAASVMPGVNVPGSPNPSSIPHGVKSRALGVDWKDARCLFGTLMSGKWARIQRHLNYHGGELSGVYIEDALKFKVHSGYDAVLKAPLVPTPEGSVLRSDRFLPAGALLTVVHFEYEVFDRFSNEWMWMPVPGMEDLDPLWVESVAPFRAPTLAEPKVLRAVRLRGLTTQRRLKDGSWSPAQKGRLQLPVTPYALADNAAAIQWPSAVVIISGHSRNMRPVEGDLGQFTYPSYGSDWTQTMARVRSLLPPGTTTVEQVEHLVTLALRAAGKGKP
ncbi:hypothetical protein [Delftia sp. PS-11]|uniref:hypothetical protein n=1 Tax=Delftia sp. PS-11 TaxID=2767222 RepID=UPI00245476EC|nr:hypothetical protein [Delftia sp. PS-11]KAJ8741829.1 hypothetical protein H9T68_20925 [Delftia sp. PS-11]